MSKLSTAFRWLITKIPFGLYILSLALAWILFAELYMNYPSNHGGKLEFHWRSSLLLLTLSIPFCVKRNADAIAAVTVNLILVVLYLLFLNLNVSIHYNLWIERGMPDWGEYVPKRFSIPR